MRLFITGATGLIGRRLVDERLGEGDEVAALSRDAARAQDALDASGRRGPEVVEGDATEPGAWQGALDGCDAVVHLAGAGVADRRWTRRYKRRLADSRVQSTRRVVEAIERAQRRPGVLVCASATGYYGECHEPAGEAAPPGDDFLARLSVRWEAAAREAAAHGVRVVSVRSGVVLDPRGGALARMLPLFRWFLGGPLGSGRQYMPWIHWRDEVGLIGLALRSEAAEGPINLVAPNPVTNREFARALGRALGRPSWLPAPRLALRLAVGELAEYLVMSQHVVPEKALDLGYEFEFARIDDALSDLVDSA